MDGLIGRKIGMTQTYDKAGRSCSVTVVEVGPCVVLQRKTKQRDGYDAVQLGFSDQKESRLSKAEAAHCRKAGAGPKSVVREFRVAQDDAAKVGDSATAALFEGMSFVDITGTTKGRGFQGVVRRFRARGGPLTHGGHSKRRVGSIGQNSFPARVAKNQIMPGHMGNIRVTTQNLRIVRVDTARNLVLVEGAIPGPTNGIVVIRKALKKSGAAHE